VLPRAGSVDIFSPGDPDYLGPYKDAAEAAHRVMTELAEATRHNAAQTRFLADLHPVIARKFAEMAQTIRLREAGQTANAVALMRTGQGRELMQQIRQLIDNSSAEETRLLKIRAAESAQSNIGLLALSLFGVAIVVAIAAASIAGVRHANAARERALQSLSETNAHLEGLVEERTTHLRQVNAELSRSLDVFKNTINAMIEAVVVADRDGHVLVSNTAAARIFGDIPVLGSPRWYGKYRRFHPDGVTQLLLEDTPAMRTLRGQAVIDFDMVLDREDGAPPVRLIANGRPVREPTGELAGAVVVYRDVTASREVEHQLQQAQKMDALGQLTGGIAHDFNNVLSVIMGTIGIVAAEVADRPTLVEIATMIDQAAERGAQLTRQLLAFARKQPLDLRSTDVNALIADARTMLRPALGETVEISILLESDVSLAMTDPSQLATALLNLAINARDAMPDGGKLTIETENVVLDEAYALAHVDVRPGRYVLVAVSDTGTGIPRGIQDRVFEPFFTTKASGHGNGLGLSMVYGFVKQSLGHVQIYSEEGHGTTVKIYLPAAAEQSAAEDDASPGPAVPGGNETILVVEDDPLVRGYVEIQLEKLGYKHLLAAGADEALAMIDRGDEAALLFTDVILGGRLNGRELAEEVQRRRPSIKVLYTSGYTEDAIVHHGRLDPGVLLLAKPYRRSDLAKMVRMALASSSDDQHPRTAS
jgi:signal transduction histidine kinase/ActR/RegA family two-component response regulator